MPIIIDAHIHIYPEFVLEQFFTAALNNFAKAAARENLSEKSQYVLALTEGGSYDVFSSLYQMAVPFAEASVKQSDSDSFVFYKTAESNSLLVCKGNSTIILIAGRQHVSVENIEVLSLFSPVKIEDKTLSLADLAQTVADNDGLPVVAWGVGKWLGARGKLVRNLIDSTPAIPLFFGDNGNRPLLWPEPSLLKYARELGYPLLSGSDPLPLVPHVSRPGSLGTFLQHEDISLEYPAASLKKLLLKAKAKAKAETAELKAFGTLTGTLQFVSDQLQINLRKRFSRTPVSGK